MHKIQLSYSKKLPLRSRNAYRELPAHWGEVADASVPFIVKTLVDYPTREALTIITLSLLDLPKKMIQYLDEYTLYDMVESITWMEPHTSASPIFNKLFHQGIQYHMPAEKLRNVTGLEYAIADDMYRSFLETDSMESLNGLVGTLLRPTKDSQSDINATDDHRVFLNSQREAIYNGEQLSDIDQGFKLAVMYYFSAAKYFMHKLYEEWIFPKPDALKTNPDDGELDFGWWGVFMSLGKDGPFGTEEEVVHQPIHKICQHLVQEKIEERRINKQLEIEKLKAKSKSRI